jgi:hypothetical protein
MKPGSTPTWWGYYGYVPWDTMFALWPSPGAGRGK